jgi:hypothetical protein
MPLFARQIKLRSWGMRRLPESGLRIGHRSSLLAPRHPRRGTLARSVRTPKLAEMSDNAARVVVQGIYPNRSEDA